jgi:hypothetical protein
MKKLMTILTALCMLVGAHAQENGMIKATYLGNQNGVYSIQVTSKLQCTSDLNFSYAGTATSLTPNSGSSLTHAVIDNQATVVYQITGNITAVTITPLGWCGMSGGGIPVVVELGTTLPVKIGNIIIKTYKKKA